MMKFKALAVSLAAVLAMGSVPVAGVSAAERGYTEKELTAHLFAQDKTKKIKCLFYEDMPNIPYISVMDYLGQIYENRFSIADSGNGVFTVTSKENKTMVIDTAKDTVHFDELEKFLPRDTVDADNDGPEGGYIKQLNSEYDGTPKGVDLNYGKYQIDLTSVNGTAYFPLSTVSDLFFESYLGAVYLNGDIYFAEAMKAAYYDESSIFNTVSRSEDLVRYTYNELCFVMDYFFGNPPKAKISEQLKDKTFDEFLNATETGAEIKPLLLSTKLADFYTGLALLDSLTDDGGHTVLSGSYTSSLMKNYKTEFAKAVIKMLDNKNNPNVFAIAAGVAKMETKEDFSKSLAELRQKGFAETENVKTWREGNSEDGAIIAQCLIDGDTVIFIFDEFRDEAVPCFKWSLDYAKEKGAKNFLIDISQNAGGSDLVVMYIMSILTGKSEVYNQNALTGNVMRQFGTVDKNLDNVIDEKDDEVSYDFRFAFLTSKKTFSCGNYLPCLAQEQGIPVIGETSGGGTCYVFGMLYPSALSYTVSGYTVMLNSKGENVENGAKADYATVTVDSNGKADYSKLYDTATIKASIAEYYANATPSQAKEKSAPGTGIPVWQILLIVIPVVLILAVVILVFIIKKRRGSKQL